METVDAPAGGEAAAAGSAATRAADSVELDGGVPVPGRQHLPVGGVGQGPDGLDLRRSEPTTE
jgi:hypothetical protein